MKLYLKNIFRWSLLFLAGFIFLPLFDFQEKIYAGTYDLGEKVEVCTQRKDAGTGYVTIDFEALKITSDDRCRNKLVNISGFPSYDSYDFLGNIFLVPDDNNSDFEFRNSLQFIFENSVSGAEITSFVNWGTRDVDTCTALDINFESSIQYSSVTSSYAMTQDNTWQGVWGGSTWTGCQGEDGDKYDLNFKIPLDYKLKKIIMPVDAAEDDGGSDDFYLRGNILYREDVFECWHNMRYESIDRIDKGVTKSTCNPPAVTRTGDQLVFDFPSTNGNPGWNTACYNVVTATLDTDTGELLIDNKSDAPDKTVTLSEAEGGVWFNFNIEDSGVFSGDGQDDFRVNMYSLFEDCGRPPTANQSIDCSIDVDGASGVEGFYRWTIQDIDPIPSDATKNNNVTLALCGNNTTDKIIALDSFWGPPNWSGGVTSCWNLEKMNIPLGSSSVSFLWDDSDAAKIGGKTFTELKNHMKTWVDDRIPFTPNIVVNDIMGWPPSQSKEVNPDICKIIVCGNGRIDEGEQCDDTAAYNWIDTEHVSTLDSKPYCHTDVHADACEIYTPSYCGDGTPDYGYLETCDDGNNDDGDSCSSICTDENSPWFKTVGGDIYSSSGVDQIPIASIGVADRRFSSYMCYNSSGEFTVGGGCFDDTMTVLEPTSNFVVDIGGSSAVEDEADAEFTRIQQKLDTFSSGDIVVLDGINFNVFKGGSSVSTLISDNRIVYVSTNITITEDILYGSSCSTQRSCSQLLFVDGDVTINSDVEHIDAFIVSSGSIRTNSVSSGNDVVLEINGGLVALDVDFFSAIELNRNTLISNDNLNPSELVIYDPRYLDIYGSLFGKYSSFDFKESGVY